MLDLMACRRAALGGEDVKGTAHGAGGGGTSGAVRFPLLISHLLHFADVTVCAGNYEKLRASLSRQTGGGEHTGRSIRPHPPRSVTTIYFPQLLPPLHVSIFTPRPAAG